MKIAFVIYDLTDGGAEKVVSLLSKSFAKDYSVRIVLFDNKVSYEYGGQIIDLDTPAKQGFIAKVFNALIRVLRLRKVLKENKFDYVFSFMESANIPSLLVNKNTIVSIRNNPKVFGKPTQFLIKKLYPRAQKVIVNSYANKEILEKEFLLNNVDVIYNPLDLDDISKRSEDIIEMQEEFIVAVGRLHHQKGFDMLIDAYEKSTIPRNIKLLIFGEGSLKEQLQSKINKYNLEDSIILMGRTDNPYKYLAKAKMFVLSSRYEGFPNVLIEAMACKCPSIAFNCPTGPSEIVNSEQNGLLVEVNDINMLSSAMERVYFSEELQNRFSLNGFMFVESLSLNSIAKQWIKKG